MSALFEDRLFEDPNARPLRGRRPAAKVSGLSPAVVSKQDILALPDDIARDIDARLRRIAPSSASVLINGETGTGKEVLARSIHDLSGRTGPFVAINCGALHEQLADAELFGHEAGAFTGAVQARAGWFETAQGGTLFLDEVGDLPLPLQVKLLRVLQEREVVRVGGRRTTQLDLRIVAATHCDLQAAVTAGRFRADLFFRLRVVQFTLPPLRDRRGVIVGLAQTLAARHALDAGVAVPEFHPDARTVLEAHTWPGNIRELDNAMQHAVLMCDGDVLRAHHLDLLEAPVAANDATGQTVTPAQLLAIGIDAGKEEGVLRYMTRQLIGAALAQTNGNQVQAARLLGITRTAMRTYVKRFGDD